MKDRSNQRNGKKRIITQNRNKLEDGFLRRHLQAAMR